MVITEAQESPGRDARQKRIKVNPAGAVDTVQGQDVVVATFQLGDDGIVIQTVALPVVSHQLLPTGQGIQRFDQVRGGLVGVIGDHEDLGVGDDFGRFSGDAVGDNGCRRTGVGGIVFKSAIFKGIMAGREIDRESRLGNQHCRRDDSGGGFSGKMNDKSPAGQQIGNGAGQQLSPETVVMTQHYPPSAGLSDVRDPKGHCQLRLLGRLLINVDNGQGDLPNRLDMDILAQNATPTGGAETYRVCRWGLAGAYFIVE